MVAAAQLIAKVSTEGIPESQRKLADMSDSVKRTQSGFREMLSHAFNFGGGFLDTMRHVMTAPFGLLDFGARIGMTVFGLKNLAQAAMSVGQSLFSSNASMEQTQVAFEQLLGSSKAANAELKDLQHFAAVTPFEFPELASATQLLLAFQFKLKDTKPLLTAVGDALSAMGKNTPDMLNQVVTVFGQMHAAGKLNAQDMMQLTSTGIPAWQMLADKMHLTVPEVQKLTSQGLIPADQAIDILRQSMEKTFGGGMQKQSQTFNGLMSTLKDNVGQAWRAFTGPLFDQAKGGLQKLVDLTSSDKLQKFAQTLGKDLGGALQTVGTFLLPLPLKLFDFISNLDPKKVQDFLSGGFKLFSDTIRDIGQWLSPIDEGVKVFLGKLKDPEVQNAAKGAWKDLQQTFSLLFGWIVPLPGKIGDFLGKLDPKKVIDFGHNLDQKLNIQLSSAGQLAGTLGSNIGEVLKQVARNKEMAPMIQSVKSFGDQTGLLVQNVEKMVGGLNTFATKSGFWAQAADFLRRTLIQPLFGGLSDLFDLLNKIIDAFDRLSAFGSAGAPTPSAPGVKNYHGPKGFATGTRFAPGGSALVGEDGMEVITGPRFGWLPRGSMVTPVSQMMGGGQPIVVHVHVSPSLNVDGFQLAGRLMPHIANQIRIGVGTHGR